ncbi:hypothetical protein ACQP1P_38510 [Dactylosporangium sp. CA-052675]|uniref:hypothetical protein n=1 Tax=Dactylosporangium sp. CA-052675 TaxID=3239927 RepID=UPI003D940ED0
MGRKVSVSLVADVAEFIKGMVGAKKSVDELGDKVDRLDDELDKIPPDAAKAAAALKLLGGDINSVGDKVNSLGEKNNGLAVLDTKIKQTRAEVKKLADEFVKTGDIDVFRKLGDAQGRLSGLQSVRKKLADAIVPDEHDLDGFFKRMWTRANDLGDNLAKMLPASISGALSTPVLGPVIAAALIAALVSAVSFVLASAGGLVLAAGGASAVGLGIMGAILGNPEVIKARWKTAIDGIKHEFTNAAQPLQQPLIDAAPQIRAAFGSLKLDETFKAAAKYLPQLVDGATEFARWIGKALNYLTQGDGPAAAMKVLSDELPMIGHAIAVFAHSIAEGGEGGAVALRDLLRAVEMLIAGLGGLIGFAEKAYGKLAAFRDAVIPRWIWDLPQQSTNFHAAARALDDYGASAKSTVVDLEAMDQKLGETSVSVDSLAGKMVGKLFSATMGLDQAVLGFNESLTKLDESFKQNGKTLDIHAAKGQANREAVLAVVQANMQQYQSNLAVGMSAEDAAKAYDDGTAALERQLRKAGLTKDQIEGLIGKYKNIPHQVDTEIAIHGLTEAIRNLDETLRKINGLKDKTVYVTVKQVGDNPRGQSRGGMYAKGGVRRAAAGMVVAPSDPGTVLFGEPETGGEALIPLRGISQGRAMALAQTVGDSYGFSVSTARSSGPLAISLGFAGNSSDAVAAMFQRLVYDDKVQLYVNGQRVRTSR